MPRNIEKIAEMYSMGGVLPSVELANNALHLAGYEAKEFATKKEVKALIQETKEESTKYATKEELKLKVDKETGKSLSTNDYDNTEKQNNADNTSARHTHSNKTILDNTTASYTSEEKTKLSKIGAGAEANTVDSVNGKTGAITLSASDVGALPDTTVIPTEYTLPTASANILGGVKVGAGLSIANGVLSATTGGTADSVEWKNVQNKPSTYTPSAHTHEQSDITGLGTALNKKQDKLTAGNGITIESNVISATTSGSSVGAVESVNNKTGVVVLTAEDVNALGNDTSTNIQIKRVWVGTEEQYQAIETIDANTEYNIIEE